MNQSMALESKKSEGMSLRAMVIAAFWMVALMFVGATVSYVEEDIAFRIVMIGLWWLYAPELLVVGIVIGGILAFFEFGRNLLALGFMFWMWVVGPIWSGTALMMMYLDPPHWGSHEFGFSLGVVVGGVAWVGFAWHFAVDTIDSRWPPKTFAKSGSVPSGL